MIDLKLLAKDFKSVAKQLMIKKVNTTLLDNLNELNEKSKIAKMNFETAKAKQNSMSKLFATYKRESKDTTKLKEEVDLNKLDINKLSQLKRQADEELENLILSIPNIPDIDTPKGDSEDDNVVVSKVLKKPNFNFKPKEHWELNKENWIDLQRGVKLAKSRFSVLQNNGAKIERALINYMLDFNSKFGFKEVSVPCLVNSKALQGTGQLPKFKDDLYKINNQDLYLIPTAEVPLTNLFSDEIIKASDLPLKISTYTPCFRQEAGSAGRDTRGIIRQHQFHKVELVCITHPKESDEILKLMIQCASELLSSLGLHHQIVRLCGADLGFSAATTFDIEVWLAGQNSYREISSISNTREFQARRAKIRFKDGKKNSFVHTLNGSSLAVGRTIVAIMENYQNEDGTIAIPDVLQSYM